MHRSIVLGGICIGISLIFNLFYKNIKSLNINVVDEGSRGIDIILSPDTMSLAVGEETSIDISVDTHGNSILAGIIDLNYDPSKISVLSTTKGSFFENELKNPSVGNGLVTLVYGVPTDAVSGKAGYGQIAIMKIRALSAGESKITFTDNFKLLPDSDVEEDIRVSINEINIIASAQVSDSASPSPTPTPSPLASPSPTSLSPDPSPSTTPTPIPTPSNLTTPPPVRKSSTPKSTSTPKPLVNTPAVVTPESIREFLPTNTPFDKSFSTDQPVKSLGVTTQTTTLSTPKPGLLRGLLIYIKKTLEF